MLSVSRPLPPYLPGIPPPQWCGVGIWDGAETGTNEGTKLITEESIGKHRKALENEGRRKKPEENKGKRRATKLDIGKYRKTYGN